MRDTERARKVQVQKGFLYIHRDNFGEQEHYWKLSIPKDKTLKTTSLKELHEIPYAGYPGYQCTLTIAKRGFYWKGMSRDVHDFVLSYPACQVEKSKHTLPRGALTPLQIPDQKWAEVSLDFIVKLPKM